jgi:hypothetical protein
VSRIQYVSGGVGTPKVEVLLSNGGVFRTLVLPEPARLNESYELVAVRNTAVTGCIVDTPRGYRYRVDMEFAALTLNEWKEFVRVFTDYSKGNGLRFYPHDDEPDVFYDILPASGMALPYLQGRYLGYEGKVSFVGIEILDYIPCPTPFSYFCSADETGYGGEDITYFSDAEETGYSVGEISYFSGAEIKAQHKKISG